MLNVRVYNRIPRGYSSKGTPYGSNSAIYWDIIQELKRKKEEEIEEIRLALYLFNNIHLYRELLRMAKKGVKVTVISLPLTGYDRRKISEAEYVYEKVLGDDAIELLVFPHMYLWYGAEYAGGRASYSFHVKAGLIKYRDGTSVVFLTSGNLAPGDPTHSETAIFIEDLNSSPYVAAFGLFFDEVEQRAKPWKEYAEQVEGLNHELQQIFDFVFIGGLNLIDHKITEAFFTAPFINVLGKGSNHYAREVIVNLIQSAERRVLVCAQHSHDLSPFDEYSGTTIIRALITAKKNNPEMDVRVLKQVASSGLADKRRAAFVECHLDHAGVAQRANKLVHDKFVIADDTVLITTSNFTATQFGWGKRSMEFKTEIRDLNIVKEVVNNACSFFGVPSGLVRPSLTRKVKGKSRVKIVKEDIFSEVNGFIILKNKEVADALTKYFESLWNHGLSSDIVIPT